jgi:hypothetical protein
MGQNTINYNVATMNFLMVVTYICLLMSLHSLATAGDLSQSVSNQFIRVKTGAMVSDGGWSFGVSWVDYNGDTYPDLYICNEDFSGKPAPNYLYHNNGDGSYTRIREGDISNGGGCLTSSWADFDNDGDVDCVAARPFLNNNLLYINNSNGNFIRDTANKLVEATEFSMEVEWVDYDNDGLLDLFIANHGRASDPALAQIYHNDNGNYMLKDNSDIGLFQDEANGIAWGDYNGDGYRDLFWSRNNKLSGLFENKGDGTFTLQEENVLGKPPAKYHGNWADFDNDGDLDLYSVSGEPGIVTLFRNLGKGDFEPVSDTKLLADSGHWVGGYWGDFDNDGWLDLIVLGNDRYQPFPNRLYHNNRNGTFSRVSSGPIATDKEPSSAAAWADHDRDGDLDLFIANVNNVNNALYENKGNSNQWIQIQLEGKRSNRSGIGATINVMADISGNPVWQMREISAKTGFKSQSDLISHFGLGDASIVDTLIVKWPSGAVQTLTDVSVNQLLKVTEQ